MGAPPSEEAMADMLSDPNNQQMMNEALNNPQVVEMMIQSNPFLRSMGPQAREMLNSPMFRQMMMNPDTIRQASQMRRGMGGGAGGGATAFPAPGVTDSTPEGAAATPSNPEQAGAVPQHPFGMFGGMPPGTFGAGGGAVPAANPFAALFGNRGGAAAQGSTPAQSPPPPASAGGNPGAPANPFAMFGAPAASGAGAPAGGLLGGMSPEMMQQMMGMMGGMGGGAEAGGQPANPFGLSPEMMQQGMRMMQQHPEMLSSIMGGQGLGGGFGGLGGASSPAAPADTRPPEVRYEEQLRQLNDMGFFDFDRNVQALQRSGGSVQGAIEQLLS